MAIVDNASSYLSIGHIPSHAVSIMINNEEVQNKIILVDGRNTFEALKHITASNNQIAYSNFEKITKST